MHCKFINVVVEKKKHFFGGICLHAGFGDSHCELAVAVCSLSYCNCNSYLLLENCVYCAYCESSCLTQWVGLFYSNQ